MKRISKINLLSKKSKFAISMFSFIAVFFIGCFTANAATAGEIGAIGSNALGTAVALVLGLIAFLITSVFGFITTILVKILVDVAQFNNIINVETVKIGWIVVRDICNMFFVLVLLVIAFATILRYENYSAKRLLPKLLIMAVLINFSRMICGVIIDFSQVIMLTFINAIGDSGGNYVHHLGVQKYLNMNYTQIWKGDVNLISTLGGMIAGIIFLVIAAVVMIILLGVLTMRIVMLWIYIVLSPCFSFISPPYPKFFILIL